LSHEDVIQFKVSLMHLGLTSYEASSLAYLMISGETKAVTIADASGIPTARIYETMNQLAKRGLVRTRPGRPVLYSAVQPTQVLDAIITSKQQELDTLKKDSRKFIHDAQEFYRKKQTNAVHSPLVRIIDLGEASETETLRLYEKSKEKLLIWAKVGKYLQDNLEVLERTQRRGVAIKILLVDQHHLDSNEKPIQREVVSQLGSLPRQGPEIKYRSNVPLRGTIVDPDSPSAEAVFLAEEADVAPIFREAAITTNSGLVTALTSFFQLMWQD
jgi:HTH-type transcriptional regulator, sugar sensing transcriptional regulator